MIQMNLSVKQTHRYGEQTYDCQEGRVGEGGFRGRKTLVTGAGHRPCPPPLTLPPPVFIPCAMASPAPQASELEV